MRFTLPLFDRDAMRADALELLGRVKDADVATEELRDRIDDYLRWDWLAAFGGRFGELGIGEILAGLLETYDGPIAERLLGAAEKAIDNAVEWAEERLQETPAEVKRKAEIDAALYEARANRMRGLGIHHVGGVPIFGAPE